MLELNNITLFCVDCGPNVEKSLNALKRSFERVKFARIIFFSNILPDNLDDRIEFIQISPIDSREQYSYFMIHNLNKYITTEFCLCVQWDGWIVNPEKWKDEFLNYDYIGAPWIPEWNYDKGGNGGFSLRSKRLLNVLDKLNIHYYHPEDFAICVFHKNEILKCGIKISPRYICKDFSIEHSCSDLNNNINETFGFHGDWNFQKLYEMGKL